MSGVPVRGEGGQGGQVGKGGQGGEGAALYSIGGHRGEWSKAAS